MNEREELTISEYKLLFQGIMLWEGKRSRKLAVRDCETNMDLLNENNLQSGFMLYPGKGGKNDDTEERKEMLKKIY